MGRNLRKAFTLTELLVVITIIGILVGLIMPAVLSARKSAVRIDCMNRLKELAQATVRYETSKQQYPGYIQPLPKATSISTSMHIVVPWSVMILPEMNRNDLWMEYRSPAATPTTLASPPASLVLKSFVCPADTKTLLCPMSYVANCGVTDGTNTNYPPDRATNGIFQNHYAFKAPGSSGELATLPAIISARVVRVSASDIKDGADYTILLSENLQAWQWCYTADNSTAANNFPESLFGMVWGISTSSYPKVTRMINTDKTLADSQYYASTDNYAFARPSSNHDNGVNVAFCDGHVSFLRENIAYTVFAQLMSPDGQRITNPSNNNALVTRSATSAWYKPIPAGTLD